MRLFYFFRYNLIITLIFLFVTFLSCKTPKKNEYRKLNQQELEELKDFSFCSCLNKEFKTDSILRNDGSSSAIIELGTLGMEHYEFADSVVQFYLDTLKFESKDHRKLSILKCLNFYRSNRYDTLFINIEKYIY